MGRSKKERGKTEKGHKKDLEQQQTRSEQVVPKPDEPKLHADDVNKKIAQEKAALMAKEAEEKARQQKEALAEAEREKKAAEELQAVQAEEREEDKEKNIEHNEAVGLHQLREAREHEIEHRAAEDNRKDAHQDTPFKKLQEGMDKKAELGRQRDFEARREEHLALREEKNEKTGKTHFEEHKEKTEDVRKEMKDIFADSKEGESPIEAMRRRKAEKLAAKSTQDMSVEERAQTDQNEQHLGVAPEQKKQTFLNDDRKAEMDEAFGASANARYTQTQKTVQQIDTPEEAKERRLGDSKPLSKPSARVARSPELKQYAQKQDEARQVRQRTTTPTPEPGHRAPKPKGKP